MKIKSIHSKKSQRYTLKFIYMYTSSCLATSTNHPDPLLPLVSVHHSQVVLQATSRIGTELLYIGSSWLSCLGFICVKGSTGVHRLCVRPYFSSNDLHAWFV